MSNLDKRKNELDPEVADQLSKYVVEAGADLFKIIGELDKRLTNTNFLTNGGGAVAVLTFMGSHASPMAIKLSLICFTLGVLTTGIEIRALLTYFSAIHSDNSKRLRAFNANEITANELGTIPSSLGRPSKLINHYAGVISQLLFCAGVVAGAVGFLCAHA